MKITVINVHNGKELAVFSSKEEAVQYAQDVGLEPLLVKKGGEVALLLRPPFVDQDNRALWVIPKDQSN